MTYYKRRGIFVQTTDISMDTITQAEVLKTIAEPTRLKALTILDSEDICVCKLAEKLNITHNLLSFHLKTLFEKGILEKRRDGNQIFYFLTKEWKLKIEKLLKLLS